MWGHVSDAELMDVLEGTAGRAASRHVEDCRECAARVEEASRGLSLARNADVPEPSPLYWESLRRQVGGQILERAPQTPVRPWVLGPALALAASLVAAVSLLLPTSRVSAPQGPTLLPAWSALPSADEDEGLEVLRAMAPVADDLGTVTAGQGMADYVEDLSAEESLALADALREELSSRGRL